ncbi:PQQ-dependent sugar dehydrogenase [Eionea flava]
MLFRRLVTRLVVSFCCSLPLAAPFADVVATAEITPRVITNQLDRPWSLAFLPNGDFLVTERTGQLRRISASGEVFPPITGLPKIAVVGQGGLLDVALHPNFSINRWVYLSYVAGSAVQGYSTEVLRGTLTQDQQSLINIDTVFVAQPKTKGGRHFGGRLLLTQQQNQTYLYLSLGDRGVKSLSQKRDNHHGSLIRLLDSGAIPADNPFVNTPEVLPEIYTYGHRNIQGLALHPVTGDLWSHEHGPQGGDELNHIQAGQNFGWPVITYGVNYGIATAIGEGTHKPGLQQPQYMWDPSIAPSGLAFYNNQWLIGALKYQLLSVLSPLPQPSLSSEADIVKSQAPSASQKSSAIKEQKLIQRFSEQRYFEQQLGRIRDVRVNGEFLYLLTDADQGKLIQFPLHFLHEGQNHDDDSPQTQ